MFKLQAPYTPTGDQPQAIKKLTQGLSKGKRHQTLLGVTGSGKTFTIANVIQNYNKPTLVISHNKTLAAQLYQEFKEFFPDNSVQYFVSYYDYYQPEAYIPQRDLYIEKDASINEEIDRLRLATTSALLTRKDVIVVASVSAIYNIGSPVSYRNAVKIFKVGQKIRSIDLQRALVDLFYEKNNFDFKRATFRTRVNSVELYMAQADLAVRFKLTDKIESIELFDPLTGQTFKDYSKLIDVVLTTKGDKILDIAIYPAKHYVIDESMQEKAIDRILKDMQERVEFFEKQGKVLEANRLKQKVLFDIEMIKEIGYCKGIENYSVYFDGRNPGDPPYSLLDYFDKDYLLIIDESHMTIPQIRGMYNGDFARKKILVDYGFRLPTAFDNRPLKFQEFEEGMGYTIYMSATPGDYELIKSGKGGIVEQLIRPTGIVDPKIYVRPAKNQVKDLVKELEKIVKDNKKALVTTLTKRMAEELTAFLQDKGMKVAYLHSDIKTLERTDILYKLRKGEFDILVGINLLREGIDLPEVSLVAIMDADKEGFLRSSTSLIQTMGRAARNINGYVILYADTVTKSMKLAIDEVNRRRKVQEQYNKEHGIIPKSVKKEIRENILPNDIQESKNSMIKNIIGKNAKPGQVGANLGDEQLDIDMLIESLGADVKVMVANIKVMPKKQRNKIIRWLRSKMKEYAQNLQFEEAIKVRDLLREVLATGGSK